MNIGLYHGYELIGSGSNEYNRYLARELANNKHTIHILCREPNPEKFDFISDAYCWDINGNQTILFEDRNDSNCTLHQLPNASVKPVYVTDKQREGNVKTFSNLTDDELAEYHALNHNILLKILTKYQLDILHCNHLVYQPIAAMNACIETQTPYMIFLHGSAIEYTVKDDERYQKLALEAIIKCNGIISGNKEVRNRIIKLYPDYKDMILAKTEIVGMGVDTQLFQSVAKQNRNASIQQLLKYDGIFGKKRYQSDELKTELSLGNIQATRNYWNNYNHSVPDNGFAQKLKSIPWSENIILFVGALTAGKGLQSVISSLPAILKEKKNIHLVIVGAGAYREVLEAMVYAISVGDKALFLELCKHGIDLDRGDYLGAWQDVLDYIHIEDKLNELFLYGSKVDKHVHFLGRLDHDLLQYLFPCADIGIFPSVVPEAYGLVLMESLSNGVFPIVSYFSGFVDGVDELETYLGKEIVTHMKIDMQSEKRIQSIISNVLSVLHNLKQKPLAHKLRPIAVDNYDWKIRAKQMEKAYKCFL
ncbi:MAG: glycosyltransferase involved in cell wall biosynthesis [Francisellaceae bacterium]|jgi:glycosyltransferase involved in cell wall biosynthesis